MGEEWSVEFRTDINTFQGNSEAIIKAVTAEATRTYLGYVVCACGHSVISEIAAVTGGRCPECFRSSVSKWTHEVEVLIDGARSTVAVGGPKKRYGSRGNPDTRRKVEAAKRRALRRLRWAHQADYEALLAEERAKIGLEPIPLERAVRTIVDATAYDPAHGSRYSDAARPPTES